MHIYSSDGDFFFFDAPYDAKRLLNDSVKRTLRGYRSIKEDSVLTGFGHILLARIESAIAFVFVAISATFLLMVGVVIAPCFLAPAIVLNLLSRIPGISSFKSVQNFTKNSSNTIYRTLKVCLIALPVIFLFLSASAVNTFLPGVLKTQNVVFNTIHKLVEHLGDLQTIHAKVENSNYEATGTEKEFSILAGAEEYFRALSSRNYLQDITVLQLTHHRRYTAYC